MFETRNSLSGIDTPHPITSLSFSFPSLSFGWSQSSHKSPLARRLKVLRTSCLEDRLVESQLKRWTFVSLQYVSVTDSTASSFLLFYFILFCTLSCGTGVSWTHFSRAVIFRLCSGSSRPCCSPRLRNAPKSSSILRPTDTWREWVGRYELNVAIPECISSLIVFFYYYFAQKHFVGRRIQGGWLLLFKQLQWFATFIR